MKFLKNKLFIRFLFGSVMVPVFLFIPLTQANNENQEIQIPISFQIKDEGSNIEVFENYNLKPQYLFQNIFRTTVSKKTFDLMKKDKLVSYVEVEQKMQASIIATDPFFTVDWQNEDKQWYLPKIRVPQAWDITTGSNQVIVAIIDTGIHAGHVELYDGRVIAGFDVTKNKAILAGADSDDNGHGTAVAGVIGAIPNNQRGISGVNWDVKLMPVKALEANGTGDTSVVAAAIVWAADNGANIINLSLGGPGFGSDQTLSNAISYAYNKGVLLVSAAGNDLALQGINLDAKPTYPVCGDNGQNMILGVTATDVNDKKADFSNFSALCVDISAPGKRILTAGYLPSDPANNVLIYGSGTSLATPIVSGVAALVKAKYPNLSNGEIRNLLIKTSDNIDAINLASCLGGTCNGLIGKGRVNAFSALAPQLIVDGSLIKDTNTGSIYLVSNKIKKLVSDFVFANRGYDIQTVVNDTSNQLQSFANGLPLPPLDGTLIKSPNEPQVYVMESEVKRPLTYLVFVSRGYSFANIKTIAQNEINSYPLGEWAAPPNQTMVLIKGDPTVYVMDSNVVRPVTFFVFNQRKLSFAKVISVTVDEFSHIPKPNDIYWLSPVNGTLIKSSTDPGIYVVENGMKRLLSFEAFIRSNYKFANVRTLPQIEIDIIAPGSPIL